MKASQDHGRVLGLVLLVVLGIHEQGNIVRCEEGAARLSPEVVSFPALPKCVLAKSKAVEGEQDPVAFWSQKSTALMEASQTTDDPLGKCLYLLAGANVILGRQLEPFSSLAILNLSPELSLSERKSIGEDLDRAEKLIGQAKDILAVQPPPSGEPVADAPAADQPKGEGLKPDRTQLLHTVEVMNSFLNGQRTYLLGESEPGARRRAASALAPLLEDPDRKVAAAARLWQALLRGLETDPTAALQILDSPMARPDPQTWPYGLYSKVLRCRYQAAQGSWSAALVMLVHIEEQLEEWVPDLAHRGDARRLFAYTRLDVLKRWHDSLPPEREAERAWCIRQADEVLKSYFSVEASLLRMEPAVPMVISAEMTKAGDVKPQ